MRNKTYIGSLFIIGSLFFLFGFLSWVNSILIPCFKICCELNNAQSYFVTFVFYIAYFVFPIPFSYLLKRAGYKKSMMMGCFLMSIGAFIFIPAAYTRSYAVFLSGLFFIGSGLALLQSAANPYVTIIGPIESAAKRMSIMSICNKVAGIIAPLILGSILIKASDQSIYQHLAGMEAAQKELILNNLVRRMIEPYSVIGIILFLFGLYLNYSPLPELNFNKPSPSESTFDSKDSILKHPNVIYGAIAMFLFIGCQIISIDTIAQYATSMGIPLYRAKHFPAFTLAFTVIGNLLGIVLTPRYISQKNMLRACAIINLFLSFCALFLYSAVSFFGYEVNVSIWFIALLGFANSMIYGCIWPLTLSEAGERYMKLASSLLVMGLAGNAILPLAYGWIADKFGLQKGYWVLIPAYLFVLFYSFSANSRKKERTGIQET